MDMYTLIRALRRFHRRDWMECVIALNRAIPLKEKEKKQNKKKTGARQDYNRGNLFAFFLSLSLSLYTLTRYSRVYELMSLAQGAKEYTTI